jgi:predicted Fe-S protein YdhL (DUF1289 family)
MSEAEAPNLKRARMRQPGVAVPSPCVNVCRLDESRGLCLGCRRTLAEIGAWSRLSDADKLAVWAQLEHRVVSTP